MMLLFLGCQVDASSINDGCVEDRQCEADRICMDHICLFPEDAERMEPAEQVGLRLTTALKTAQVRYLAASWPLETDYSWGFQFDEEASYNQFLLDWHQAEIEQKLSEDFSQLLEWYDYESCEFIRFEPGRYRPLPLGEEYARRSLDRLVDSSLLIQIDDEQVDVPIAQLVRLRGRWRLFRLLD